MFARLPLQIRVKEAQTMNKSTFIPAATNVSISDFASEIISIIRSNLTPGKMREAIGEYHEKDIAATLALLTKEECRRLFRIMQPEDIANVLEYAQPTDDYFEVLGINQKTEVLSFMETSSAVELLQSLSKENRTTLLDLIRPDIRAEIKLISSFDEDEIGSKMSTNFIAVSNNSTVKLAMSELICQAAENDNISTLYVVDENKTFCGAIDLKDLIIARENTPLSEITTLSYPYLYAKMEIQDCIPFLRDYSESSIPVLDDENKLLGVVTSNDFIEILGEELIEDYAKLGGLSSEEDLAEPIFLSIKKRIPWLTILLVLGLGVSATVGLFESIVAQLPVIMCFQSLILDMAGNVGTQSLAVAIRVLMDAQIDHKQKAALVWKEVRIGFLNGLILGVLSFAAIGGYLCITGNAPYFSFAVSGCLGIAMILAMMTSSLSGTVIPIFFTKIGIDPAVASGPLITTINDLVAVVSYYGLSWIILLNIMKIA